MEISILKVASTYKSIRLVIYGAIGIVVGMYMVGPLLRAELLEWIAAQPKIVKELLNINSVLSNMLIRASIPLFVVWGAAFYLYKIFVSRLDILNKYFPLANLLCETPASIFLVISTVLFGVCLDGWLYHEYSPGLISLSIMSVVFVIVSLVLGSVCSPKLEQNKLLDKYYRKLGHICIALAVGCYLWGVFAEPLELYLILRGSVLHS